MSIRKNRDTIKICWPKNLVVRNIMILFNESAWSLSVLIRFNNSCEKCGPGLLGVTVSLGWLATWNVTSRINKKWSKTFNVQALNNLKVNQYTGLFTSYFRTLLYDWVKKKNDKYRIRKENEIPGQVQNACILDDLI